MGAMFEPFEKYEGGGAWWARAGVSVTLKKGKQLGAEPPATGITSGRDHGRGNSRWSHH